jgi:capsule polysaccharide export protein KpsC/LpsZ
VDVYNKEHSGLRKFVRISKATWPFVKDGSIFERATKYFFKLFKSNVIKEYKKFETIPDFNKKFIYIALHFQPERTTSPQGGYFVDQLLMIKTLSSALPKDWLLYVKEHPSQWKPHSSNYTGYRYPGYYAEIAKLKNAKIIPITTDNYKLIKNSEAVSTITGIPGWEAVLRGKPAFIFGYSWFMHAPGVFRVRGVRDCREAIKKIENGYKVDKQKMLNYIALLDRVSFEGFNDNYGRQVSKIKDEENAMNILKAIEEELKTV